MAKAMEDLKSIGFNNIEKHEATLKNYLIDNMKNMKNMLRLLRFMQFIAIFTSKNMILTKKSPSRRFN